MKRNPESLVAVTRRLLAMEAMVRSGSRTKAAKLLGCAPGTVSDILRDAGFKPTERPQSIFPDDLKRLQEFLARCAPPAPSDTPDGFDRAHLGC